MVRTFNLHRSIVVVGSSSSRVRVCWNNMIVIQLLKKEGIENTFRGFGVSQSKERLRVLLVRCSGFLGFLGFDYRRESIND